MTFKQDEKVLLTQEGYDFIKDYVKDMISPLSIGYIHIVGAYGEDMNDIPPGWYHVIFRVPVPGSTDVNGDRNYSVRSFTIQEKYLVSADKPNFKPVDVPDALPGQRREVQQVTIATIQLAIKSDQDYPEDIISVVMREAGRLGVIDWQYLKVGKQYMKPTTTYVPKDYEEGDAFQ